MSQHFARLAALALGLFPLGCGATATEPTPTAALAGTIEAQVALDGLIRDFARGSSAERIAMKSRLTAFRTDQALTPLGRTADALLAWIALEEGDLDRAIREAAFVRTVAAAGTTSDLARTVQGAALRRQGHPEQALSTLSPLVSKLIDGYARALFNEEIVLAAVEAGIYDRALTLIGVWLREAALEDQPLVRSKIDQVLTRIPASALLRSLGRARGAEVARLAEEEQEIRKLLARRLARVAQEQHDPDLAKRVLDSARDLLGDQGDAVAHLATGATRARVEPQTIGLLLSLGDDVTRHRAAEVVDGLSHGLGLPGSKARLVSRENRGGSSGVEDALALLSTDGASILIAGLDDESAVGAAIFAEKNHIPVILLRPPVHPDASLSAAPDRFTFVLGEDPADVERILAAALVERGSGKVAIVAEDPARHHGASGPDIVQILGCGSLDAASHAADLRGAVLGGSCAKEALHTWLGPKIRFAMSFESTLFGPFAVPKGTLFAKAGLYPLSAASIPPEIKPWMIDHPAEPGWWAGLGHDAAVLAWAGVSALPETGTEDPDEVGARRARATAALGDAQATLWTSEARGFGGKRLLPRAIRVE
ncbi:MAG: hypothetical protein U0359_07770 [Byssovorax sp.]